MNCKECRRPILRPEPSKRTQDTFIVVSMLWAVLGVMVAGGFIEAIMATHWATAFVTVISYAAGTTILTLWWKIKNL